MMLYMRSQTLRLTTMLKSAIAMEYVEKVAKELLEISLELIVLKQDLQAGCYV